MMNKYLTLQKYVEFLSIGINLEDPVKKLMNKYLKLQKYVRYLSISINLKDLGKYKDSKKKKRKRECQEQKLK